YPEEGLAIYDTPLTTPLGTIWLKQGAQVYLEEQTRMQVEPTYQRLQLVGNSGILANDVQLLRIEKQTAGR
ncbi:MAG: iron-sulfur cluster biosynthesis family protein, partial [Limosilactobacillus mucosae]|nr:iron-sulfur cluster biosynthesis family protein [Limosilactobacillus mucosae]